MSLYHKYRPTELTSIVGNQGVVESLSGMLKKDTPHVFLLTGPTGCGKTTIGRIIATELGAVGSDFAEMDTADFRGIDTIRKIRETAHFSPLNSTCRVWLMDECHKLTGDAQSALLKILEDTPKHVYFILCTTDPQKLLPTIKGRCSLFEMAPLEEKEMFSLLRKVIKAEDEVLEKVVYDQIIQDSFGHPRNALQILDKVLRVDPENRLAVATKAAENQSQSIELCRILLKGGGWKRVREILKGLKNEDPESIRRHVLGYCQSVLLNGDADNAGLVMEEMIEPFYNTGFPGLVFACYSIVKG
ncbi:MAG: AAA family ATPase [Candidatus Cloacimonadota bacterium]|nr:MAG: AAA family ATPase [Candidatus Cloacimonadota bacterium]